MLAVPTVADEIRIEGGEGLFPAGAFEVYRLEPEIEEGFATTWATRVPRDPARPHTVDLPAPGATKLALLAEGFWAPPCEVSAGVCRLEIEPAGVSSFRLSTPTGTSPELPEVLVATGWLRQADEATAEVPILCRRRGEPGSGAKTPAWVCPLPLGGVDLRLDLPGFAPAFLWDVRVAAGVKPEPVPVELLPGAHVEAWIDASSGTARLRPAGRWRNVSEERLAFATREIEVAADGRLHFEHVAPGRYELTVETPDGGRGEIEVPVEASDRRVVLREIALTRPERAEIQVDPPMDGRGEPWQVTLSPVGGGARGPVTRVSLDLTGYARVEDVTPGRYYVTVRDSQGSLWHLAPHELDGAGPLVLSIPHVPVEGRIRAGEEGLAATLVFGTTQGVKRLRFRSDERGRFSGYLPSEGLWEVELGDEESGCDRCGGELGVTLIPPVGVEVGPSGKAILDIVLPDTLVEGRVVRNAGGNDVPVAGAQVVAGRPGGPPDRIGRLAQVWTGEDGRFALRGIEPGRLIVAARTDTGEAEASVELREGLDLPEIELRIEETVTLQLRLTHAGAPVPGARVHAFPGRGFSAQATTDLDGRADLRVPARSSGTLLVDAQGLALRLEAFAVADEPPPLREVGMGAEKGDLVLEGLSAPPHRGSLVRGGAAIEFLALRTFARERVLITPAGVVYAGLEAGDYSVCRGSERDCRGVTVPPAGTASLNRSDWEESAR